MPVVMSHAHRLFPGLAAVAVVALAAQFLSEHYGAPAMLMAILIGLALNFLSEAPRARPGIDAAARTLLRLGVALLGLKIGAETLGAMEVKGIVLILAAVPLTIGAGLLGARLLNEPLRFGFLTGGAVAICGASAAMAIGALLPADARRDRDIAFAVIVVTVLSTLAMIFYPVLARGLGLDPGLTGLLLGATIHDVAQVVGAGFSVSAEVGELSTVYKLLRVMMLAPVVIVAAIVLRRAGGPGGSRPPLVPAFVLAFIAMSALSFAGVVPGAVTSAADPVIRALLLMAVAAVGIRTHLPSLMEVGARAMVLVLGETLFLLVFVTGMLMLWQAG